MAWFLKKNMVSNIAIIAQLINSIPPIQFFMEISIMLLYRHWFHVTSRIKIVTYHYICTGMLQLHHFETSKSSTQFCQLTVNTTMSQYHVHSLLSKVQTCSPHDHMKTNQSVEISHKNAYSKDLEDETILG